MLDLYLEDTLNCIKELNIVVKDGLRNQGIILNKVLDIVEKVEKQEQEIERLKDFIKQLVVYVAVLAISILILTLK